MAILAPLAALLIAAFAAFAQQLAPLPAVTSRVTDTTATLSAEQVRTLEAELAAFEAKKGSQIAIVIVPTTEPETIDQYTIRLAERVKVGRKKIDDGVIILIAKNDQRVRIEVGYGLEGAIPDVTANRVRREVMNPHLRAGNFYEGLRAGSGAVMKLIEGEALPAPAPREAPGFGQPVSEDWMSILVIGLVLIVMFGGILTSIFGRFFGSTLVGGIAGGVAWMLTSVVLAGVGVGVLAFIFALLFAGMFRRGGGGGWPGGGWTGGWGGGGWSSGGGNWSSGGGSWSGGGGSFGGGGASGSWND